MTEDEAVRLAQLGTTIGGMEDEIVGLTRQPIGAAQMSKAIQKIAEKHVRAGAVSITDVLRMENGHARMHAWYAMQGKRYNVEQATEEKTGEGEMWDGRVRMHSLLRAHTCSAKSCKGKPSFVASVGIGAEDGAMCPHCGGGDLELGAFQPITVKTALVPGKARELRAMRTAGKPTEVRRTFKVDPETGDFEVGVADAKYLLERMGAFIVNPRYRFKPRTQENPGPKPRGDNWMVAERMHLDRQREMVVAEESVTLPPGAAPMRQANIAIPEGSTIEVKTG